tara:strand:+ start:3250 stop:7242 length:3993 start_codon:yes stop_codon:yes gene_type:complete
MSSYELNGLISDILPNVYINKITLEGTPQGSNKIASSRQNVIEAHIDKRDSENNELGGWQGNNDKYINKPALKITYDLLVEVPETGGTFLDLALSAGDITHANGGSNSTDPFQSILQFIKVNVMTFKGEASVALYRHLNGDKPNTSKFGNLTIGDSLSAVWKIQKSTSGKLKHGNDYKLSAKTMESLSYFNKNKKSKQKGFTHKNLSDMKQKLAHQLPDGTIVYKIPVKISHDLLGETFPDELAAIATCTIDLEKIFEMLSGLFIEGNSRLTFGMSSDMANYGKHASELIVKGGQTVEKGMVFFVSTGDENNAFNHLKGKLWLGGVHKHNNRFMAGNIHTNEPHPFLDYLLVDNNRIVDFRQEALAKKQLFDINPLSQSIFGGNYTNLQSKVSVADFSQISCFSDLISSVDTDGLVKLYFCIDWGKIVKRYCAIPRLLDKMSLDPGMLETFFKNSMKFLSFKIYRRRLNVSHDIMDQDGRELVYDNYPQMYYFGNRASDFLDSKQGILPEELWPQPISALSPINISYGPESGAISEYGKSAGIQGVSGFLRHYTFTDYNKQKINKGVFEYSLEIEMPDFTLSFLSGKLKIIRNGLEKLAPYAQLANGTSNTLGKQSVNYFDPYSGIFNAKFKKEASKLGFVDSSGKTGTPDELYSALSTAANMMILLRSDTKNKKNLEKQQTLGSLFKNMLFNLNPVSATPDSINGVYEIVENISNNLQKIINSFSTAKTPKTTGPFKDSNGKIELLFTKSPSVGAAHKRKIKITHTFNNKASSELVDTKKAEAGYEFLPAPVAPNASSTSIGLKSIMVKHYKNHAYSEIVNYFPSAMNLQLTIPFSWKTSYGNTATTLESFDVLKTAGRYFRVPVGYTHLPKTIVGKDDDNDYWKVANDIIRYKKELYGNPSSVSDNFGDTTLFDAIQGATVGMKTGDNSVAESLTVTRTLERLLKEYQTLNSVGVYFPQTSISAADDISISMKITEGGDAADFAKADPSDDSSGEPDGQQESWDGPNNPMPDSASNSSEDPDFDSQATPSAVKIPYQESKGQEQLLMSLINMAHLKPNYFNLKLGSFDATVSKTAVQVMIERAIREKLDPHGDGTNKNEIFYRDKYGITLGAAGTGQLSQFWSKQQLGAALAEEFYFNKLPYQILALIVNHIEEDNVRGQVSADFQYWFKGGASKLYDAENPPSDKNMFVDKFGQFWFNHQNLGEIEYLAGYGIVESFENKNNVGVKYEDIYGSSVKVPYWRPLSTKIIDSWQSSENVGGHLLCRIKKHRDPMYSTRIYEKLDLPIFDEHFFIASDNQLAGGINTYYQGKPAPSWLKGPTIEESTEGY